MRPLVPVAEHWHASWNGSPLALPGGGVLALRCEGASATTVPDDRTLMVHYRSGGEHIKPAGSPHTRELRLLLQEAGIPPWQRDRIPLISVNGDLIAVGDLFLAAAAVELCARMEARIVWEHFED